MIKRNESGMLVNTTPPRLHGDPRTTGRQETASQRRQRRRAESRGHAPRRERISREEASSSAEEPRAVDDVELYEVTATSDAPFERSEYENTPPPEPHDGRCSGRTKRGTRCRRKTDELYCSTHQDQA